jgi:hypothetical protein
MSYDDYRKQRKYLENEIECHFENLSEAMKNNIKASNFNMFKSSIKNTIKSIDALDKAYFVSYIGKSWDYHLGKQKQEYYKELLRRIS